MNENNDKNTTIKNTAIIRVILCVISIAIVVISWLDVIPDVIGIVAASVFLIAVSVWNGIESLQEGKKGSAILKFVMAGILAALCIIVIVF